MLKCPARVAMKENGSVWTTVRVASFRGTKADAGWKYGF